MGVWKWFCLFVNTLPFEMLNVFPAEAGNEIESYDFVKILLMSCRRLFFNLCSLEKNKLFLK